MGQFVMGMAMAKQQQRVFNEKLSTGMLPRDPNDIDTSWGVMHLNQHVFKFLDKFFVKEF